MQEKRLNTLTDTLQNQVYQLLEQQTRDWELAQKNYKGLEKIRKNHFDFENNLKIFVQFNPERIYSSAAKVDDKSISERKCFLCPAHLPQQQKWVEFGDDYVILVNPFPIFPKHLTIPLRQHTDQRIQGKLSDMLLLAKELPDFEIFYNGPRCGASAPDHFHFQAGNKGFMPLESDFLNQSKQLLHSQNQCNIWSLQNYLRHCLVLEGAHLPTLLSWFDSVYQNMQTLLNQEPEPMMNIIANYDSASWKVLIFPRTLHRPHQFFAEGESQILLSPASVDLGGVLITPREVDFDKINPADIRDIFAQVSWDEDMFQALTKAISNF